MPPLASKGSFSQPQEPRNRALLCASCCAEAVRDTKAQVILSLFIRSLQARGDNTVYIYLCVCVQILAQENVPDRHLVSKYYIRMGGLGRGEELQWIYLQLDIHLFIIYAFIHSFIHLFFHQLYQVPAIKALRWVVWEIGYLETRTFQTPLQILWNYHIGTRLIWVKWGSWSKSTVIENKLKRWMQWKQCRNDP